MMRLALARTELERGRFDSARDALEETLDAHGGRARRPGVALDRGLCDLGGEQARARRHLEEAAREARTRRDTETEILAVAARAVADAAEGRVDSAREDLRIAAGRLGEERAWLHETLDALEALVALVAIDADSTEARRARERAWSTHAHLEALVASSVDEPDRCAGLRASRLRPVLALFERMASRPRTEQSAARARAHGIGGGGALVVAADRSWFETPDRARGDLSRSALLRRLLGALVERHLDEPGAVVTSEELIEAGWPDQGATTPESMRNRLHVALNRLRTMGLDDLVETLGTGYRLDPQLPVLEID
jgi:hypothetical protein